ncbi:MAG: helix-turn-helix transcriptional regulator [Bacilli bacterium]|nr:helix-turn-helix transcriptional regulator [Bacilli bacterium]
MMHKEGFHKTLRAFISENHYTIKEAAAALHTSRTTLNNWLNGGLPNGEKMLDALSVMAQSISDANMAVFLSINEDDWEHLTPEDIRQMREDAHRRAFKNTHEHLK